MADQDTTPTDSQTAPSAPTDASADLTAIASKMANDMPDVQEHAVQQAAQEQQAAQNAPVDKNGAVFDPGVHVVGPDGKGVFTVRGTWAMKRGRKGAAPAPAQNQATSQKSTLGGAAAQQTPQMLQNQQNEAKARAAGVAAAELLFMSGKLIGGEEWEPAQNKALGLDERALMHQAFGDYFVAKGVVDIPPGAALVFCVCAYVAPRFAMPKTQSRFARAKQAIVTWWVNRKLRKHGLEVEPRRDQNQTTEK